MAKARQDLQPPTMITPTNADQTQDIALVAETGMFSKGVAHVVVLGGAISGTTATIHLETSSTRDANDGYWVVVGSAVVSAVDGPKAIEVPLANLAEFIRWRYDSGDNTVPAEKLRFEVINFLFEE